MLIRETPMRSLLKTLSWRLMAAVATIAIVWFMTGKWTVALSVGGVEAVGKLVLFYGHERLWQRLPWGFSTVEAPQEKPSAPAVSEAQTLKT